MTDQPTPTTNLALVQSLWPKLGLADDAARVWLDAFRHRNQWRLAEAIRTVYRQFRGKDPALARILDADRDLERQQAEATAKVNERDLSADEAAVSRRCRQDADDIRQFLDGQDAETLSSARRWLGSQSFAKSLTADAEAKRTQRAFLAAAIRYRLWEPSASPWWERIPDKQPKGEAALAR